ncbi:DUF4169 family protein [Dongia sp.]|uniref:DUF4169 family protein n=1 Tax=Dongia sp. TaxID=1977262 RepID=UPI0035B00E23
MAEIVNLNRFRKARQRQDEQKKAAENRVQFGRNKAEKASDRQARERFERDHAGKELGSQELDSDKIPPKEPA